MVEVMADLKATAMVDLKATHLGDTTVFLKAGLKVAMMETLMAAVKDDWLE